MIIFPVSLIFNAALPKSAAFLKNSPWSHTNPRGIKNFFKEGAHKKQAQYRSQSYHAWERGTNENTNGLLRQYFPKNLDFNLITPEELAHVVKLLNDRPRKRLKFKSPRQTFQKD